MHKYTSKHEQPTHKLEGSVPPVLPLTFFFFKHLAVGDNGTSLWLTDRKGKIKENKPNKKKKEEEEEEKKKKKKKEEKEEEDYEEEEEKKKKKKLHVLRPEEEEEALLSRGRGEEEQEEDHINFCIRCTLFPGAEWERAPEELVNHRLVTTVRLASSEGAIPCRPSINPSLSNLGLRALFREFSQFNDRVCIFVSFFVVVVVVVVVAVESVACQDDQ